MKVKWYPKTRKYDDTFTHILNQLQIYPVCKVNTRVSQDFGRQKPIRMLSRNKMIYIKDGVISLPHKTKIEKKGDIFYFLSRL